MTTVPIQTLHSFYDLAESRGRRTGERYGQAMFNHLLDVWPEMAERIRGTNADPFHCETRTHQRVDAFVRTIESMWPRALLESASASEPDPLVDIGDGWTARACDIRSVGPVTPIGARFFFALRVFGEDGVSTEKAHFDTETEAIAAREKIIAAWRAAMIRGDR